MTLKNFLFAMAMALASAAPAAATNSPMELKSVLNDLMTWMPGVYSSAPQVFFENSAGPPPDGPHENLYRVFAKIDAPHLGEHVIYTQIHIEGKDGPMFEGQQLLFLVDIDKERQAVRIQGRRIANPEQFRDAHLHPEMWKTIAPDPQYGGNCEFLWRRHGAQIVGKLTEKTKNNDTCTMVSKISDTQMTWDAEWILNDHELWVYDNGSLKDGSLFSGRADKTYLRMSKTRSYECFASYRPVKGDPIVNSGFAMHDGADRYTWAVQGVKQPVHIVLKSCMWPSESGQNYKELLRIEMYQGDPEAEPAKRKVLGNGWAGADSDRASFGTGTWGARCKLAEAGVAPPKAS